MGGTSSSTIYTATTFECIQHLGKNEFSLIERTELERKLDSNWITIRRWMNGSNMPKGTRLIKLRVLLLQRGYRITDLEGFDNITILLCCMLASGELSLDDIRKALDYRSENEVLRLLLTPGYFTRMSTGRQLKAQALAKVDMTAVAETKTHFTNDMVLKATSNLIKALLPFAESIAADNFSADERKRLRELSGSETIFRLSNAIVALTGEKARDNSKTPSVKRS